MKIRITGPTKTDMAKLKIKTRDINSKVKRLTLEATNLSDFDFLAELSQALKEGKGFTVEAFSEE